jgi:hypothetical protein
MAPTGAERTFPENSPRLFFYLPVKSMQFTVNPENLI